MSDLPAKPLLLCARHRLRGRAAHAQWFSVLWRLSGVKFAQVNFHGWYEAQQLRLVAHPENDPRAVELFLDHGGQA